MHNKIEKKIKSKISAIELNDKDIRFSKQPQNVLAILNYGLLNGIKTEELVDKFGTSVIDIVLPANKSYSFFIFKTCDDAENILNKFNGEKVFEHPLLLSYVENIPTVPKEDVEEPKGLIILEDFISEELEHKLISLLEFDKLKNRQIQHFGYEFIYGTNTVDPNKPLDRKIPDECYSLWKDFDEKCPQFKGFRPDQLTVNKYNPGNGIPSHCDTHSIFEELIISLSLGASIVMEFKNPINGRQCSKLLPRKSLLIMSGESRYGWTHGITPKSSDIIKTKDGFLTIKQRHVRYSYTFRKLRVPQYCDCIFPSLCDFHSKRSQNTMSCNDLDNGIAAKLELENVHNVYNEIGTHFSETRHSPWPNVENFISNLKDGSILLDVGCGNGKYLNINDKIIKLGCDRSEALLQVCCERNFQVFECDCLQLPMRDESVDACISIAVIHHLATHERRVRAIKEILRVLRKDGLALIYVWAKNQQKDDKKTRYLLQHQSKNSQNVTNLPEIATLDISNEKIELPIHRNRTQFNYVNLLVPWKLKRKEIPEDQQKVFLRYYHIFEDGELESLCEECGNIKIDKSYYDQGNHCVILKKL